MAGPLLDDRTIGKAIRAARSLPRELRAELRTSMNREVAAPVARQIQAAAGREALPVVQAFRNRGVAVKPGEEPTIVVGGPEPYGHGRMRNQAFGAEYGGGKRESTYTRKGRKRGRRRGAAHTVNDRRTTRHYGGPVKGGRFVGPTLRREAPAMQEAFLRVLARVTDDVWGRL